MRAGAIGPTRQLYCGTAKFLLEQTLSGDSSSPKGSGGRGSNSPGARHASLLHAVCEKNVASIDPAKRRYAGEAASALSFWALGLRPTPRSGLATPRSSSAAVSATESVMVSTVSAMESGTESCPRSSEVLAADLPAPVPTDERPVLDLATLKLPVPIPRQDPEFEAYYAMSPISESGAPAGSEAGVRTPGSKDLPLTIEADDDDIDEDLPSTSPPVVEPRTPIQPSGAAAMK